jgi:drug/metabolite transporter (DMT)-like permease
MLLSAALHAGWNLLMRRHYDAPAATVLLMALACCVTLAVSLLGPSHPGELRLAFEWGLLAGLSEGLYFVTLGRALHIGPLAPVYTVARGLPLVVLWPASHWLLGERIDLRAIAALTLLLTGLFALIPTQASPLTTTRRGYLWAVATAVFNATNAIVYKAAVVRGAPPLPLFGAALIVATPLAMSTLASWKHGGAEELARRLGRAWLSGQLSIVIGAVACTGSFLIALNMMRYQGAAWVLTLRNASIAFAQILGWAVLREMPSRRAFTGVLLVFGGALVLGMS